MKKIIIIPVLIMMVFASYSQNIKPLYKLATDIVDGCNGTIMGEEPLESDLFAVFSTVPDFYSLDLVKTIVKMESEKYSDISVHKTWTKGEGNTYTLILDCGVVRFMQIMYVISDPNGLIISWNDGEIKL